MPKYTEFEHIFKKGWCPLLAEIPGIELPKYDPLGELAIIIERSRTLLGVKIDFVDVFDSHFPSLGEVQEALEDIEQETIAKSNLAEHLGELSDCFDLPEENISLELVKSVREIFRKSRCLNQYAVNDEMGVAIEGRPSHLFIKEILQIAGIACNILAPDHVVIASLAIKSAYSSARDIVIYDEAPDATNAWGLLRAAEKIVAEQEITSIDEELELAEDEIETLTPLAANEKKTMQ